MKRIFFIFWLAFTFYYYFQTAIMYSTWNKRLLNLIKTVVNCTHKDKCHSPIFDKKSGWFNPIFVVESDNRVYYFLVTFFFQP
jgi:hypothetical protein